MSVDPNTICASCGSVRSAHEALALAHDRPPADAEFKVMPLTHLGLEHHYFVMEAPLKVISPLRDDQGRYVEDVDAWLSEQVPRVDHPSETITHREHPSEGVTRRGHPSETTPGAITRRGHPSETTQRRDLILPGHEVDPKQVVKNVVKWGRLEQAGRTCAGFVEEVALPPEHVPRSEVEKPWRVRARTSAARMRSRIEEMRESLPDAESLLSGLSRFEGEILKEPAPAPTPQADAPWVPAFKRRRIVFDAAGQAPESPHLDEGPDAATDATDMEPLPETLESESEALAGNTPQSLAGGTPPRPELLAGGTPPRPPREEPREKAREESRWIPPHLRRIRGGSGTADQPPAIVDDTREEAGLTEEALALINGIDDGDDLTEEEALTLIDDGDGMPRESDPKNHE